MSQSDESRAVIVHATDLMPDGQATFDHACALARQSGARLVSIHARGHDGDEPGWDAAETLERLAGLDDTVDHETQVVDVKRESGRELSTAVDQLEPDLVVLGTRQQSSGKWRLSDSVSEVAVAAVGAPTLVVHIGQEGLVDAHGDIGVHRIVVPVGDFEEARAALKAVGELAELLDLEKLEILVVHVGVEEDLSELKSLGGPEWTWSVEQRRGSLIDAVAELVDEEDVDLIAMATRGKDEFSDLLLGTKTRRVIRRAPRPILAVALDE